VLETEIWETWLNSVDSLRTVRSVINVDHNLAECASFAKVPDRKLHDSVMAQTLSHCLQEREKKEEESLYTLP